jgi:hypothetical protein
MPVITNSEDTSSEKNKYPMRTASIVRLVMLVAMVAFPMGCEGDGEDEDAATMCYHFEGSNIVLNCYNDYLHSCEDDGYSSLGSYDTWDECWEDTDSVADTYSSTGEVTTGSGSSGSGSSTPSGSADSLCMYYDSPRSRMMCDYTTEQECLGRVGGQFFEGATCGDVQCENPSSPTDTGVQPCWLL